MRSTLVFKRSLKMFLFQTAYSRIAHIKLDSVMRHRSSCMRRTKSTVDYNYNYDNSPAMHV